MSAPNDGGPAFPVHETPESTDTTGMSLRDFFAAKAMGAMCAGTWPSIMDSEEIGRRAYIVADAMLKARTA